MITRPIAAANLCLLGLVLCTPLAAQTNRFYVTDETDAPGQEIPASPKPTAPATASRDSRPATDDPEGNWGSVTEGFQLSIRFGKDTFTNGEPVIASIILRNVSTNKLWYPVAYGVDRQTTLVLKRDQNVVPRRGEPKLGTSLEARLEAVQAGAEGLCPSWVGTQRRFYLGLNGRFELSPGTYSVEVRRRVTNLNRTAMVEAASGRASFRVVAQPKALSTQ